MIRFAFLLLVAIAATTDVARASLIGSPGDTAGSAASNFGSFGVNGGSSSRFFSDVGIRSFSHTGTLQASNVSSSAGWIHNNYTTFVDGSTDSRGGKSSSGIVKNIVPEPSSMALMILAVAGVAARRRRSV